MGLPEDGLADREGAQNFGVGGVWVEGAPESRVVGLGVRTGGEEESRSAAR